MNELNYMINPIENWIKIVFILCSILILISRINLRNRFKYFITFWNIHRYFYFVSGERLNPFNNSTFFILRILLSSLLVSYIFDKNNSFYENNFENFLYWNIIFFVLITSKFAVEKLLSFIFNYKTEFIRINKYRIGIKNLFSIHLYFFLFILIFGGINKDIAFNISLFLVFTYHIFFYKFISSKDLIRTPKSLVYFILYLCTFEIIPIVGIITLIK